MPNSRDSYSLVSAIVDDGALVQAVTELDPGALAQLVRHVGLEDSGSLLALATPEQLRGLADDDLWCAEPGQIESFDVDRFAVWVEVLLGEGRRVAADALSALDDDLLALALSEHMLVLDLDQLAPLMAEGVIEDAELVEKVMEAQLAHELDELLLLSKVYDGWDALIDVLHELDTRDHDRVRRILERVCAATMDRVADDGLYTVLSQAESLMEDVRGERNDRREERGFVAGADARAFLAAARSRGAAVATDPVALGYFRRLRTTAPVVSTEATQRLATMLRKSDVLASVPALPAVATGDSPTRQRIAQLRDSDPERHGHTMAQLMFLANVLVAGGTVEGEPIGRVDAVNLVLTTCDAAGALDVDVAGVDLELVALFGAGWKRD